MNIDAPSVEKLHALCKKHESSMTALLQTLTGTTLFKELPDATELRYATAIQLWRFIDKKHHISDDDMGLWIDGWHQRLLPHQPHEHHAAVGSARCACTMPQHQSWLVHC